MADLTDKQLLAYLQGNASAEITEKMRGMTEQTLARLRALADKQWQELAFFMSPLQVTEAQLQLYAAGDCTPQEQEWIAYQLRYNPQVQAMWQTLRAPAVTRKPSVSFGEQMRYFFAQLMPPQTVALGLKGAMEQQVYQADEITILFHIDWDTQYPNQVVLLGSLMGVDDDTVFEVSLWQDDGELKVADGVVMDGDFMIGALSQGIYDLIIEGGEPPITIYVSELRIDMHAT